MSKRKTTQKFIIEAVTVHGEKYEYSQSEYKNGKSKVKIFCEEHGFFEQNPNSHLKGQGCPKCVSKKKGYSQRHTKEIFIENAIKIHNGLYDYSESKYINTDTKVQILCKFHNKYFWQTPSSHINGKCGCPKCGKLKSNNILRKTKEEFVKEAILIHGDKYDYSESKYINTDTKVQILCKFHNKYFWQTPSNHINAKCGCPKCAKLKLSKNFVSNIYEFIEKATKIHKNKYLYNKVRYINAHFKVEIICPKHGIFKQTPNSHLNGAGCPKCVPSISKQEQEVIDFIRSLGLETEMSLDTIIHPKHLDIFVKSHNIAIEYNGLHWHCEFKRPNKNYHLNKTQLCEAKGIQLIHIFEDEWLYKKEIVKSRLTNIFGLNSNKIFARKTFIKEVTNKESREFLDNNHLQGNSNSKIRLGLYYNNKLVSLMTFGNLRKNLGGESKEGYYELTRFSNILNTNVVGSATKLFKHFMNNYQPKQIISYADRRWSQGKLYKTLGFDFIHNSAPSYFYVKNNKRKNRFGFRKDILIKEGFNPNKTEHEIMLERKIYRIYDCGTKKYVINF